jgi:hypothetical protein
LAGPDAGIRLIGVEVDDEDAAVVEPHDVPGKLEVRHETFGSLARFEWSVPRRPPSSTQSTTSLCQPPSMASSGRCCGGAMQLLPTAGSAVEKSDTVRRATRFRRPTSTTAGLKGKKLVARPVVAGELRSGTATVVGGSLLASIRVLPATTN